MKEHLIQVNETALVALERINNISSSGSLALFVLSGEECIGTLTDGDIRRGLLKGNTLQTTLDSFLNKNFQFLRVEDDYFDQLSILRKKEITLVPVLNQKNKIIDVINLSTSISKLPLRSNQGGGPSPETGLNLIGSPRSTVSSVMITPAVEGDTV